MQGFVSCHRFSHKVLIEQSIEIIQDDDIWAYLGFLIDRKETRGVISQSSPPDQVSLPEQSIEIDPEEGPVDTPVEVVGWGFASREDIVVEFDGDEVDLEGEVRTDDNGEFSTYFYIPESPAGVHTVTSVIGLTETEAEFNVEPCIMITPQSGEAGTIVTISGTGFARKPSEATIYFDNTVAAIASPDGNGSFNTTGP